MKLTKFLIENYAISLILIFGAFLLSININKPYIGHHDFNSAFFSQIARNLTRVNIASSKLGQVLGSGPLDPKHLSYYIDNVPLHPWLIALSFRFFGQGEFQARIISSLASLGSIFFIYKITKKLFAEKLGLFSKSAAILAGLLYVTSPMFIYFGSNVFPEPLAIFFSLSSFYFFILYLAKRRVLDFYLLLISSTLSLLTVWGSYFLVPFLILYYLVFEDKKDIKKILIFAFLPFIVFGLFLLHLLILRGTNFVPPLASAFTSRLNIPSQGGFQISSKSFFWEEFHRTLAYYSKTTIALSLAWFLLFAREIVKKDYIKKSFLLLSLMLWGISYPLFFRQAAFIHDYFLIYLSPFIAISASVTAVTILKKVKPKNAAHVVTILFVIGLPLIQFSQTKNFTSALLSTNGSKQGMELGRMLAKSTGPEDKILVLSGQFGAHFGVFMSYYADRIIDYQDFVLSDFQKQQVDKKYGYIVYIDGRDTAKDVDNYLIASYPSLKNDIFTLVKTKQ